MCARQERASLRAALPTLCAASHTRRCVTLQAPMQADDTWAEQMQRVDEWSAQLKWYQRERIACRLRIFLSVQLVRRQPAPTAVSHLQTRTVVSRYAAPGTASARGMHPATHSRGSTAPPRSSAWRLRVTVAKRRCCWCEPEAHRISRPEAELCASVRSTASSARSPRRVQLSCSPRCRKYGPRMARATRAPTDWSPLFSG